jgi:hypothetical protein
MEHAGKREITGKAGGAGDLLCLVVTWKPLMDNPQLVELGGAYLVCHEITPAA